MAVFTIAELLDESRTVDEGYEDRGENRWSHFAHLDFKFESVLPPTCPESCTICCDQFVPNASRKIRTTTRLAKLEQHDDATAASTIDSLVEHTNADCSYILGKIESYGNTIKKQWVKATPTKRMKLIRTSMPNIFPYRFSNLEIDVQSSEIRAASANNRKLEAQLDDLLSWCNHEGPHLVPFLSTQALTEDPMRLLALIHHRAHAHQSDWISFDRENIRHAFHYGRLKTAYNPHCVSVTDDENFGKLVPWEKDAAHRWDMIGYPLARNLFRAQLKITNFLRTIIDQILKWSKVKSTTGDQDWGGMVEASFRGSTGLVAKARYVERGFTDPPKFEIYRIFRILHDREDAALGEILSVQSDPSYLRHILIQTEASKLYQLAEEPIKPQLLYESALSSMFRLETIRGLVGEALTVLGFLEEAEEQGRQIQVSGAYLHALRKFEARLMLVYNAKTEELQFMIAGTPAFRRHFNKEVHRTTTYVEALRKDPLFWVMTELCFTKQRSEYHPASFCFTFFDDHMSKAKRKEQERVDQVLYDHVADMAAIDEVLTALKSHRSFECNTTQVDMIDQDDMNDPFATACKCMRAFADVAYENEPGIKTALLEFLRFPLPPKAPSMEKLSRNAELHQKFSAFWQLVRTTMIKEMMSDKQVPEIVSSHVRDNLNGFGRDHAQIFDMEQKSIAQDIEAKGNMAKAEAAAAAAAYSSVFDHAHNIETLSGKALAKELDTTVKIKTRPTAANVANGEEAIDNIIDEDTAAAPILTIEVKPRNLEVFKQMFSAAGNPLGKTRWDDFVAAMIDAGCSATHCGGSAVGFEDERNKKGSIVIHRPHPDPTIDPIKLRWIGKRLGKRFGWGEDTFVEREKEDA